MPTRFQLLFATRLYYRGSQERYSFSKQKRIFISDENRFYRTIQDFFDLSEQNRGGYKFLSFNELTFELGL